MMFGIFIAPDDGDLNKTISAMDKHTREWEMRAARGECAWVCASCCSTFPAGMPDACEHGDQGCTDIIKRDKANALLPDNALYASIDVSDQPPFVAMARLGLQIVQVPLK